MNVQALSVKAMILIPFFVYSADTYHGKQWVNFKVCKKSKVYNCILEQDLAKALSEHVKNIYELGYTIEYEPYLFPDKKLQYVVPIRMPLDIHARHLKQFHSLVIDDEKKIHELSCTKADIKKLIDLADYLLIKSKFTIDEHDNDQFQPNIALRFRKKLHILAEKTGFLSERYNAMYSQSKSPLWRKVMNARHSTNEIIQKALDQWATDDVNKKLYDAIVDYQISCENCGYSLKKVKKDPDKIKKFQSLHDIYKKNIAIKDDVADCFSFTNSAISATHMPLLMVIPRKIREIDFSGNKNITQLETVDIASMQQKIHSYCSYWKAMTPYIFRDCSISSVPIDVLNKVSNIVIDLTNNPLSKETIRNIQYYPPPNYKYDTEERVAVYERFWFLKTIAPFPLCVGLSWFVMNKIFNMSETLENKLMQEQTEHTNAFIASTLTPDMVNATTIPIYQWILNNLDKYNLSYTEERVAQINAIIGTSSNESFVVQQALYDSCFNIIKKVMNYSYISVYNLLSFPLWIGMIGSFLGGLGINFVLLVTAGSTFWKFARNEVVEGVGFFNYSIVKYTK